MRELHLFAGIGGGILAGEMLGHTPVCAVENNPFCQEVLRRHWPELPIYDDVRTFNAAEWTDRVDVVAGGFPCQDISAAGKGEGLTGARSSLWFEMLRVVSIVRPRFVFVENSPMLRTRGLGVVLRGLAELGFDAAWDVVSAADVGANHLRKRMWVLAAHPDRERREEEAVDALREDRRDSGDAAVACSVADASCVGRGEMVGSVWPREPDAGGSVEDVADAGCERGEHQRAAREVARTPREAEGEEDQRQRCGDAARDRSAPVADAGSEGLPLPEREELCGEGRGDEGGAAAERGWWCIEPDVGRVAYGVPDRVDRLRGLGNAQVPLQAAFAFQRLLASLMS